MAPTAGAETYRTLAAETASGPQLLVMLYERLTGDVAAGADAIDAGDDLFVASQALIHAQQIIQVLRAALDPEGFAGATELLAIYDFVERELVQANLRKEAGRARACLQVLEPLRRAWSEAVEEVGRGMGAVA